MSENADQKTLARAALSGSETVRIEVIAPLYSYAHTSYYPVTVYARTLTSGSYEYDITIPVPCEEFYFVAFAGTGTTSEVSLRYYLTWA